MRRGNRWFMAAGVSGVGIMFVCSALAQQADTNNSNAGRRGQPQTAAPRTATRGAPADFDRAGQSERHTVRRATADYGEFAHTDQQLAAWLLVDNRGEIALAQLAQEKTSNSEVRDFAQHLIDDHSKMVEKLEQFAGTRRRTRGNDNRTATNRRPQTATAEYAGGQGRSSAGLNFVRLKQQLGQQCLASSKQELEQKDGNEFDECYIGMQIAKHMEMIDTLKVFSHYASENLDQVIEEGEDTSQEHLDHAKKLIKELTSDGHSQKRDTEKRTSSKRDSETR